MRFCLAPPTAVADIFGPSTNDCFADLAVVGLFEANVYSSAFWIFCRKQQLAFEVSLIDTFVSLMHGRRHRWTKIQFCKYMSNGTVIIL